jgi:hypothetical protein
MRGTSASLFGLLALATAACGGGGAAAPVEDEPRASAAVAAAAVRVANALAELASDPAGISEVDPAIRTRCERGSLTGVCVAGRRVDVVRLTARRCELRDAVHGTVLAVDGRFSVSAAAPACGLGGLIPPDIARTFRLDGFSAVVSDGAGVVEAFTTSHLVETALPLLSGCDGSDAVEDLDGEFTLQRRGRPPLAARAAGLHLERRALAAAAGCAPTVVASGRLVIADADAGTRSAFELDGFAVALDPDGAVRRIEGGLALPCAPPASVVTDVPLRAGMPCPLEGRLLLTRRDGSHAVARFTPSGMEIDADADGIPEATTDCAPACGA